GPFMDADASRKVGEGGREGARRELPAGPDAVALRQRQQTPQLAQVGRSPGRPCSLGQTKVRPIRLLACLRSGWVRKTRSAPAGTGSSCRSWSHATLTPGGRSVGKGTVESAEYHSRRFGSGARCCSIAARNPGRLADRV